MGKKVKQQTYLLCCRHDLILSGNMNIVEGELKMTVEICRASFREHISWIEQANDSLWCMESNHAHYL